jgi:hypothetical protein
MIGGGRRSGKKVAFGLDKIMSQALHPELNHTGSLTYDENNVR